MDGATSGDIPGSVVCDTTALTCVCSVPDQRVSLSRDGVEVAVSAVFNDVAIPLVADPSGDEIAVVRGGRVPALHPAPVAVLELCLKPVWLTLKMARSMVVCFV